MNKSDLQNVAVIIKEAAEVGEIPWSAIGYILGKICFLVDSESLMNHVEVRGRELAIQELDERIRAVAREEAENVIREKSRIASGIITK